MIEPLIAFDSQQRILISASAVPPARPGVRLEGKGKADINCRVVKGGFIAVCQTSIPSLPRAAPPPRGEPFNVTCPPYFEQLKYTQENDWNVSSFLTIALK